MPAPSGDSSSIKRKQRKWTLLEAADRFICLGGMVTKNALATRTFSSLQSRVWKWACLTLKTKLFAWQHLDLSVLLYGSGTWTTHARHLHQLEMFHHRKIKNVWWWQKKTNCGGWRRANMSTVGTMVRRARLPWLGHTCLMPEHRRPKRILFGELLSGTHSRGRSRKRWKDVLTEDIEAFGISPDWYSLTQSWSNPAGDRQSKKGAELTEAAAAQKIVQQRQRRHAIHHNKWQGPADDTDDDSIIDKQHIAQKVNHDNLLVGKRPLGPNITITFSGGNDQSIAQWQC